MPYTTAAAIKAARGEIGERETGTNKVKYNDWFGRIPGYPHNGYGYPWCMSFQAWVADRAGGKANVDYPRTAGCEAAVIWFKARDWWSSTPHVGDLVFYGPRGGTHVELVVAVDADEITTVGGNTSGSLSGQYFNGDGVYEKTVSRSSSRIYGYGRPNYQQEDDLPSVKDVWTTDGIIESPPNKQAEGNKYWTPASYLVWGYRQGSTTQQRVIALEKKIDAMTTTIDKLVDALGAAQPDLEALKTSIREAIESVSVRLDVAEQQEEEQA